MCSDSRVCALKIRYLRKQEGNYLGEKIELMKINNSMQINNNDLHYCNNNTAIRIMYCCLQYEKYAGDFINV